MTDDKLWTHWVVQTRDEKGYEFHARPFSVHTTREDSIWAYDRITAPGLFVHKERKGLARCVRCRIEVEPD